VSVVHAVNVSTTRRRVELSCVAINTNDVQSVVDGVSWRVTLHRFDLVDPGVKVNEKAYYCDIIICKHDSVTTFAACRQVSEDRVPAPGPREMNSIKTIIFLECRTPALISPDLRSPNGPDLN